MHQKIKPYLINLINAAVLLLMGGVGLLHETYFEGSSTTAMVPVAFGLMFAIGAPVFKQGNQIVRHLIVAFTLLLVFALFPAFQEAISRQEGWNAVRIGLMLLTGVIASLVYWSWYAFRWKKEK